jgi:hypothetical protein
MTSPNMTSPNMTGPNMADSNQNTGTTGLQLTLAWLLVGIPLTWGVVQTLINSMKLFQ